MARGSGPNPPTTTGSLNRDAAPATDSLLQALTALGMPAGIASNYLKSQAPLRSFGDVSVRWTGDTTANMAEAALHILVAPATAETILATLGTSASRSLHAVNATLSEDDPSLRASRRTWGLRCWGITEYAGIAHAIGARIDAAGGTVEITDVIEELLTNYPDIVETSIRSYLSTLEFIVTAGVVRRRTQDDEWPTVAPLNTVRGAFRNGDNEIRLLVRVTSELLRGSGQTIHPAVALRRGSEPGPVQDIHQPARPGHCVLAPHVDIRGQYRLPARPCGGGRSDRARHTGARLQTPRRLPWSIASGPRRRCPAVG